MRRVNCSCRPANIDADHAFLSMTPNDRKITDVLAAIEAAAQESRRATLAHVARAGRLTEEELLQIEDSARRAEMMGRTQASALDARDELRAVSEGNCLRVGCRTCRVVPFAPSSQGLEPPGIPGRFSRCAPLVLWLPPSHQSVLRLRP